MGLKRSFDEGDLQVLSFKHPKQLQSIEQLTSLAEINPPDGGSQKADLSGKKTSSFFFSSLSLSVSFFFYLNF